ncbi:MAG: hypothetical protein ACI8X5_001952 [Planctomycetota bacterium]|jgi:hypothetical protein
MHPLPTMDISFLSSISGLSPYSSPGLIDTSRVNPIAKTAKQAESERGVHGSELKDTAKFSKAGLAALARDTQLNSTEPKKDSSAVAGTKLSAEERDQVRELKARDTEVRAHESAHAAAAGSLAKGGPSYEYARGPDGASYAVAGEVSISVGGGSTPEEKLANATQAQRAATAPANPSGADRAVAAHASQVAASARAEISKERTDKAPSSEVQHSPEANAKVQNERRAEVYGTVADSIEEASSLLGDLVG